MIYKRGRVYWYKFVWHGALVRETRVMTRLRGRWKPPIAHRWRRERLVSEKESHAQLFPSFVRIVSSLGPRSDRLGHGTSLVSLPLASTRG
jgi:hypothetical protein